MAQIDQNKGLILIVDDDTSMRMLMSASLQQAGYEVAEAENGKLALEQFNTLHPDAVLLDVMMPELDGFETCSALRKLTGGKHTPVLMITGLDDAESIHRAFESGATDFITKPITWAMLGYRVRYMLRANQAFLDLHHSQSQLSKAQHLAKLGNWELNPETNMLSGSPELFELSGLDSSASGIALERFVETIHPSDREPFKVALKQAVQKGSPYEHEYRVILNDDEERIIHLRGEPFCTLIGKKTVFVGYIQDVSELRSAEEQIRYLAYYDGLTGLANRELFHDRLHKALAFGSRQKQTIAVLFLDLDRFKRINDTLGHHIGDELLKNIAERINLCVRESDSVARFGVEDTETCVSRLGGDEFTILLTDLAHPEDAAVVARRIIAAIPQPLTLQGHELYVTTSIGISVFPHDGEDAYALLKNADAAMYDAKNKGRNNFQFYKETLSVTSSDRFELESDLRKALDREEFVLHYQPQVDVQTGRIVGTEALIRWNNPERGLVSPAEFIPLAEELGIINPLTEWVIKEACEQNKAWQQAGLPPIPVSVNISGQQFSQLQVAETAQRCLEACGLDPKYLEVELTESTLMENKDIANKILEQLRALSITIAIDDFGTGYSSLAYLKTFPIDTLKIDRSFVNDITTDPNDAAIVRAIIAMAHSLELKVIAEGVETEDQLDFLRNLDCNEYQGFLFSRPLPAEELALLVKASRL